MQTTLRTRAIPTLTALAALAAILLVPASTLTAFDPSEKQVIEKTLPFAGDKDIKIGIKVGDVTIDSVRIRHWPDAEDFEKAERDLNDKHTMVVEFRYSNRDEVHNYKCKYTVMIPGDKGELYGENDRTATLDKGKIGDTNKMFVKMKTRHYKTVKNMKVKFEIWRK